MSRNVKAQASEDFSTVPGHLLLQACIVSALLGFTPPRPTAPKMDYVWSAVTQPLLWPFHVLEYGGETLSPSKINHFSTSWALSPYKPLPSLIIIKPAVVLSAIWCCWAPLDTKGQPCDFAGNTGQGGGGKGRVAERLPAPARASAKIQAEEEPVGWDEAEERGPSDTTEPSVKAKGGKASGLQPRPGTEPGNSQLAKPNSPGFVLHGVGYCSTGWSPSPACQGRNNPQRV